MEEAVTSLDWFLKRVRERARLIVEASQQAVTVVFHRYSTEEKLYRRHGTVDGTGLTVATSVN